MALKSCQLGLAVCCWTRLDERIKLYVFKPLLSDCYYWSQFPTDAQPMPHLEELVRVFKLRCIVVWFLDVVQGVIWEGLERWKSWVSTSLSLLSENIFNSICFSKSLDICMAFHLNQGLRAWVIWKPLSYGSKFSSYNC